MVKLYFATGSGGVHIHKCLSNKGLDVGRETFIDNFIDVPEGRANTSWSN